VIDANGIAIGLLTWGSAFNYEDEEELLGVFMGDPDEGQQLYDDHKVVDDCMQELPNLAQVVDSATTIFEALDLFALQPHDCFCVLHINHIIGYLEYSEFSKPAARLAFLARVFEIEHLALQLIRVDPASYWSCLSDGRQKIATEIFRNNFKGSASTKAAGNGRQV
jgi:hypothetical protein